MLRSCGSYATRMRTKNMSYGKFKEAPIRLEAYEKRDVRTQFAALCWKVSRKGKVKVALVTSRRTQRWILPKGWPMDGVTPSKAAATEAFEEAGLKGQISDDCMGIFSFNKVLEEDDELPCVVAVFPMRVETELDDWPEASQRERQWFGRKKASRLVESPELARMIKDFDPLGDKD